jgi:cell division control protein 7
MTTAIFFAPSSSNPLDVGSEDPRNATYKSLYNEATAGEKDSDDVRLPYVTAYQRQVNDAIVQRSSRRNSRTTFYKQDPNTLIDLDAEMDDEDEANEVSVDLDVAPIANDESNIIDVDSDLEEDVSSASDRSDDEEHTILAKPREEQEEIISQMTSLQQAVPSLTRDYRLTDRLGTGTFSTVFKAIDLHYHTKWDNSLWNDSLIRPPIGKVFVALKRIYVTSSPERIRNEIAILESCRGARHISQIITAFRNDDQIVLVLPYQRNDDFRVRKTCLETP